VITTFSSNDISTALSENCTKTSAHYSYDHEALITTLIYTRSSDYYTRVVRAGHTLQVTTLRPPPALHCEKSLTTRRQAGREHLQQIWRRSLSKCIESRPEPGLEWLFFQICSAAFQTARQRPAFQIGWTACQCLDFSKLARQRLR